MASIKSYKLKNGQERWEYLLQMDVAMVLKATKNTQEGF